MTDPSRLPGDLFLARLGCNHLLRMLSTVSELFDGDMMLGIVFVAISQASTDHLGLTQHHDPNAERIVLNERRRPVTVLSVAESLNLPRETVRRHVAKLIERGYCAQVQGRRVIVPATVYDDPRFALAIDHTRRDLQVLVNSIRRAGVFSDEAEVARR